MLALNFPACGSIEFCHKFTVFSHLPVTIHSYFIHFISITELFLNWKIFNMIPKAIIQGFGGKESLNELLSLLCEKNGRKKWWLECEKLWCALCAHITLILIYHTISLFGKNSKKKKPRMHIGNAITFASWIQSECVMTHYCPKNWQQAYPTRSRHISTNTSSTHT